ncbi:MAG: UTP--glucose-1-phosphate uridylyltransferase [Chroococcopsis gigantea SAG 12.99]|jgi:UTP--glucose-1-phosphate uridylyltransferase|nr:UTP--glucose-1-phosphate uridylyltransferase [Chlorogloea purpurea SAG 13.99]MDV2999877.1 UTP--glucose-1-phosphate uridylyltransferase [Chroococcopsis gigantea SAG 12.99]
MSQSITKAVIPAAGFGTRLYPTTKVFKKEFFPVIDRDGIAKPVILMLVEELLSAGIEEIAIVIQPDDLPLFQYFFQRPVKAGLAEKLSADNQDYDRYLLHIGKRVTFIPQETQEGYGHAVYCARNWVNDQPFLLTLGDHIYLSHTGLSCAKQLVEIYKEYQTGVIALTIMAEEIIHKAGIVTGDWLSPDSVINITKLSEKPDLNYARSHLQLPEIAHRNYLGVFGLYILDSYIFDYLEMDIINGQRYRGEFQLTTCLDRSLAGHPLIGYRVRGQYFDTGMPEFYRQTLWDFLLTQP